MDQRGGTKNVDACGFEMDVAIINGVTNVDSHLRFMGGSEAGFSGDSIIAFKTFMHSVA